MTKKPKTSVDYSRGVTPRCCRLCFHYRHNSGTCALVEGKIEPWMWCQLFKPER